MLGLLILPRRRIARLELKFNKDVLAVFVTVIQTAMEPEI